MQKRDVFLPSLTTIIITAMMFFLSCASQNRVKDELDLQAEAGEEESLDIASEEVVEEGDGGEETVVEVAEGGETAVEGEEFVEGGEQLEQLAETPAEGAEVATAETPVEGQQDGLDVLDDIKAEETGVPADTASTEVPADGAGDELAAAAATTIPADSGADAVSEISDVPMDNSVAVETPSVPTDTYADSKPIDVPSTPSFDDAPKARRFSGVSRVPTVPGKAVTRGGESLNRFYFVRQGDTPSKVSELLYGNSDRARDLKKWNSGSWSAGKMVYYASPVDPNDGEMHSFYQERNVTPEEYTVQSGDWVSTIAKKRLGNWNSWKEIAVVNGMMKPDALEVGQKLAIYPKDLSGFGGAPQVAQQERQPEPPPQQEPVIQEPERVPVQPPPQQAQIPQAEEPIVEAPPQAPPPKVAPPQPEALDTGKFIEQNALAIVILGAALVLLLALVMRKKKAPKLADEFGEDNFAPPTKLKRK